MKTKITCNFSKVDLSQQRPVFDLWGRVVGFSNRLIETDMEGNVIRDEWLPSAVKIVYVES